MQLAPNQFPRERLLFSMEAQESRPVADDSHSRVAPKATQAISGNRRWLFIGPVIGVLLFSVAGFVFNQYRDENGQPMYLPTFVRARTQSLAAAGTNAPVFIQLNADMVRVSAISLGHPRLAVINGKTVAEGDSVVLQAPGTLVALILRVAKIGDGSIELTDGNKFFSAQLAIPSPPKPKPR